MSLAYNHNRLVSFFTQKCPRCGKTNVFVNSMLKLSKFAKTNATCVNCSLVYEPEPGFFIGSMYWSYAILIAMIATLAVISNVFNFVDQLYIILPITILLVSPFIFRYSRLLMLYIVYPIMYKATYNKNK